MPKTIKARYRNGLIEPLEKIDHTDGTEITITVSESSDVCEDGLSKSFGGGKGWLMQKNF